MAVRPLLSTALMGLAMALCATHASATSVVPIGDDDLATTSRAVVEGTVVATEAHWREDAGCVVTYVTFDVERTFWGNLPPGLVVFEQLGGETPEIATVIFGAPAFVQGTRALLFLNADSDGVLHVAHLMLGYFRIVIDPSTGRTLLRRPAESPNGEGVSVSQVSYDEFLARTEAVLARRTYEAEDLAPLQIIPDAYAAKTRAGSNPSNYTFLGSGYRWFEPDAGDKVRITVNGELAPTPSRGVEEATAAFAAWSDVARSQLEVRYAGPSTATGVRTDDVSVISFGDPRNQIDDLVNCQGVVAMAGLTVLPSETVTIGRKRFTRIREGDLVVNNGIECLVASDLTTLKEIVSHEFGHILGLGHSSELINEPDPLLRDASMYFVTHKDGRGASLRLDDIEGIRFLYGTGNGALRIESLAVPDAVPGTDYDYRIAAAGGSRPYAWQVTSGSLPSGLSLTPDGHITGAAAALGEARFSVTVRDSDESSLHREFALSVTETPAPFVTKAAYKAAKSKLVLKGWYFDETASIEINGVRVIPPGVIRYNAKKGRITVPGSPATLNLDPDGTNVVTVSVRGRPSNTVTF